jgi:23S rRNA (pseudouridine1915-N3)-methyltransferase
VALDRRGEAVSSETLARRLTAWRDEWPHPIAFLLGSDLGLDEETVLERARWRWSLGPLTLPHELARLVVYEQLYRALCIAAGINYHRQPL